MESYVLKREECRIAPDGDLGEYNTIASQHAIGRTGAAGTTVYLPAGEHEFACPIRTELNSTAGGRGSLRIRDAHGAKLFQTDDSNLFAVADPDGERGFGRVYFDVPRFSGSPKPADFLVWDFALKSRR